MHDRRLPEVQETGTALMRLALALTLAAAPDAYVPACERDVR